MWQIVYVFSIGYHHHCHLYSPFSFIHRKFHRINKFKIWLNTCLWCPSDQKRQWTSFFS